MTAIGFILAWLFSVFAIFNIAIVVVAIYYGVIGPGLFIFVAILPISTGMALVTWRETIKEWRS